MCIEERLSYPRLIKEINNGPNLGAHCHVFTSENIIDKIIYPIIFMQLIPFKLVEFIPAKAEHGGEMIAIFRKDVNGDTNIKSEKWNESSFFV
jgi:hypothetical protein